METDRLYVLVNLIIGLGLAAWIGSAFLPSGTLTCLRAANGLDCAGCGITRTFRSILGIGTQEMRTVAGLSVFCFVVTQIALRGIISFVVSKRGYSPLIMRWDIIISTLTVLFSFWWLLD